jgi:hypothetical protein
MAENVQQGTVLKTGDGSTYFIRQEILDLCRVPDEDLAVTEQMVDEQSSDVQGFALGSGNLVTAQPVAYGPGIDSGISVSPNILSQQDLTARIGARESTIMCCW